MVEKPMMSLVLERHVFVCKEFFGDVSLSLSRGDVGRDTSYHDARSY